MRCRMPVLLLPFVLACADAAAPARVVDPDPALRAVDPHGGSMNVDPAGTVVTLTFSRGMPATMADYVALHQGDVTGPVVPGTWQWSPDGAVLTFHPDESLAPATTYTVHIGGGMMDGDGQILDLEPARDSCGGQWVTDSSFGAHGTVMGHGGMGDMMGPGWDHGDGTYGLMFTFTTA